jgi:predicted negative regulator of RcsB-dependent stress response
MRRSHGLLVFVLLIALLAFAWWRGWLTFNKENIQQDKNRAKEAVKEGAEKIKQEADKLKGNLNKDSK